jgi:hypothetical protein
LQSRILGGAEQTSAHRLLGAVADDLPGPTSHPKAVAMQVRVQILMLKHN